MLLLALPGCEKKKSGRSATAAPGDATTSAATDAADERSSFSCRRDEGFAESVDVIEASGAALLPGGETIAVVGDSGSKGEYVVVRTGDGSEASRGNLPLDDGASDDLEGLSFVDGELIALTSSGWFRHWKLADSGPPVLTQPAYAGAERPELLCSSSRRTNCGMNYEGLCLAPAGVLGECQGAAVSKQAGAIFCVRRASDGRLSIDDSISTRLARPETLTGCHVGDDGAVWVGANLLAGNQVFRVVDFGTDAATVEEIAPLGVGFCEAISLDRDGAIYRFSDTARRPSFVSRFVCEPAAP